jgi:hypothetical protein
MHCGGVHATVAVRTRFITVTLRGTVITTLLYSDAERRMHLLVTEEESKAQRMQG